MKNLDILIRTLSHLILQLKDLIKKLDVADYSKSLEVISGSSIGQHIRHILEFIEIFLQQTDNIVLSYEERKRDVQLERDPSFVITKIQLIVSLLENVNTSKELILKSTINPETLYSVQIDSSTERELLYLIEHTIHHMAIIGNAVRHSLTSIKIDKNFGYAFSTIVHNKTVGHGLTSSP
ncbi:MAG: hypothetical protein KDK90_23225 [Leptospiraceae bacterium]|nr:hypothetical protein [Leptospiraceae bacterium]